MTLLQIVSFLLCPLMMLFCMKGMFSSGKEKKSSGQAPITELQNVQIQMAELIEQNHQLQKELQLLKEQTSDAQKPTKTAI